MLSLTAIFVNLQFFFGGGVGGHFQGLLCCATKFLMDKFGVYSFFFLIKYVCVCFIKLIMVYWYEFVLGHWVDQC